MMYIKEQAIFILYVDAQIVYYICTSSCLLLSFDTRQFPYTNLFLLLIVINCYHYLLCFYLDFLKQCIQVLHFFGIITLLLPQLHFLPLFLFFLYNSLFAYCSVNELIILSCKLLGNTSIFVKFVLNCDTL